MDQSTPAAGDATLGDLIRRLRLGQKWSQEELAAKCEDGLGINQGALSHWERNSRERVPSLAQVLEVVRATAGTTADLSTALSLLTGLDVEVRGAQAAG